jgi:septum formation protein
MTPLLLMTTPPALILASTSRYRQSLLQKLQLSFTAYAPNVDEAVYQHAYEAGTLSANALAQQLAHAKAAAVAQDHPHAVVIGSDQVASCDHQLLHKPKHHDKALAQLLFLQGKVAHFDTAVCVMQGDRYETRCVTTEVKFRVLSHDILERYLHLEQPYDCAGSAKSEGMGIMLMEYIRGDDPNALIGLPLIALIDLLTTFNVPIATTTH